MKLLVAVLGFLFLGLSADAQIKKAGKPPKFQSVKAQTGKDSIMGYYAQDTMKARITVYTIDDAMQGGLGWIDGYIITRKIRFADKIAIVEQKIYNKKWEMLRPEDVDAVKERDWQ